MPAASRRSPVLVCGVLSAALVAGCTLSFAPADPGTDAGLDAGIDAYVPLDAPLDTGLLVDAPAIDAPDAAPAYPGPGEPCASDATCERTELCRPLGETCVVGGAERTCEPSCGAGTECAFVESMCRCGVCTVPCDIFTNVGCGSATCDAFPYHDPIEGLIAFTDCRPTGAAMHGEPCSGGCAGGHTCFRDTCTRVCVSDADCARGRCDYALGPRFRGEGSARYGLCLE